MRIGFAGASGTGKSTLAEWASKQFELEFNPVGSRSVAKAMGFDNPYDVDAAGKRAEFQRKLLDDKVAWELERESFITDRTVFDNLAYTIMHDAKAIDAEILAKASEAMLRYDQVFICPVKSFCHTAGDPHRVADLTYHRVYEAILEGLFQAFYPKRWCRIFLTNPELEMRQIAVKAYMDGLRTDGVVG